MKHARPGILSVGIGTLVVAVGLIAASLSPLHVGTQPSPAPGPVVHDVHGGAR
jgi:hypothetical protein